MQKKRMLAGMLAGAVTLSSLSLSAMAVDFLDTQGHWGSSSVSRWADYGVVNGSDGKFNPDASMTRAEMATILVNLLDLQEKGSNTFSDVQAGAWYEDAILKCAAAGIMKGDGNGANPNGKISREEAAVMLGRALGIEPATGGVLFGDGAQVADWAAGYVKALSDRGIINGVGDNQFAPQVDISRASVTTILDKSISTYANKDGETITASGAGIVLVTAKNVTVTGEVKGGLLVSPAVAGSALTVDNAKISGGVTVQGSANIALTGTTTVDKVSLDAQGAKLTTTKDTTVQTISATAPQTEVTVGGKANTIDVAEGATGAAVNVSEGATVQSVTAAASGTNLSVAGTVSSVTVADTASGSTVTAEKTGAITSVNTSAAGTTVKGEGKVESVTTTNKSDTTVSTPGTTTTEVKPTTPDTPSTPGTTTGGGSTSGGGGGGGGGSTGGGGGGGGSDSGDTDDKVTTESRDVIAAGLHDQSGEIKGDLAKDYSVSALKYSNVTHTNVTVKATDLQFHKASDDAGFGYWVGVGIPRADKDKAATVVQGWGSVPATTTAEYKAPDANAEANGKTYDTVYFNVGSTENTNQKGYLFVKSVEGEGESAKETITRYEIDFSGVKLSTTATEFSTSKGFLPEGASAKYLSRTTDAATQMETIEIELTGSVAHGLDDPNAEVEADRGELGYDVINAALVGDGQNSTYATIHMERDEKGILVQTNPALKHYLLDDTINHQIEKKGDTYVGTSTDTSAQPDKDFTFPMFPNTEVTIVGDKTYVLRNKLEVTGVPSEYTVKNDTIVIREGQSFVIKAGKKITVTNGMMISLHGTGEQASELIGEEGAKLVLEGEGATVSGEKLNLEPGSYTWTDGAWKADATTPPVDPEPPVGDPVDVIAAGLFDQSNEIATENLVETGTYTVKATQVATKDYVDVTVAAKKLQFHKASDGAGFGYWVGVGILRADKDKAATVVQGWGEFPKEEPTNFVPFDSSMESEDKTKVYDTVYFNVGSANNEGTGYLFVKNGETVEKYQIDFKGVKTLAETKEFSGTKSFLPEGAKAQYVSRVTDATSNMETITIKLTGAVNHGLTGATDLDYPVINAALVAEGQNATRATISMQRGEGGKVKQTNPALKYYMIDGGSGDQIKLVSGEYVKEAAKDNTSKGDPVDYDFAVLPSKKITIVGDKTYILENELTIKPEFVVPTSYETEAKDVINIAAGQSIEIGAGKTITIAAGSSLTIADTGSLTGAGTLIIEDGATVTGLAGVTGPVAAGTYTYDSEKSVWKLADLANATELTAASDTGSDPAYDTFMLKNGETDFLLQFNTIKSMGYMDGDTLKMYELVKHVGDNKCPAEFGDATAGKCCMVDNATGHDAGLTLKNGAEAREVTYYFQTADGWYVFTVTVKAKETTQTPAGNENSPAEEEQPSTEGENTDTTPEAPAEGENANPPAEGENTEGGNTNPPAEGENTDTPAEGGNTDAPAEGGNTDAPAVDAPVEDVPATDAQA